jgi:RHS repeat-associated protein
MLVGTGAPTIKAYYKYDPFGRTLGSAGSLVGVNAMRFSSKPVMGSSELYYYGYRFYDPSSQRWLSRDPLGEAADRNIYAFVRNGPANNRDSYGLLTEEQIQQIIQNFTLYGGVAGGIIGGAGGGTGGALVGLPSGPGAIATGAAGAAIGAAEGAVIGSAAGAAIGASTALTVHAIQKFFEGEDDREPRGGFQRSESGDCTVGNAQFREALRRLGLKPRTDEAEELHRHISKQGYKTVEDIIKAAEDLGY